MKNKVYIVGAGPGDPGLITVKGLSALRQADVVVYDSLVNPVILLEARPDSVREYRGKRGNEESSPQDEINALLKKYYDEGKNVVRLKGGDPWIFSRGAEEAAYLNGHKIPFEIIPGISSALAAPTYAGIQVTHRDYSSSFAIATGKLRSGKDLDELVVPKADTIVYLMATSSLESVVKKILDSGLSPETSAALIENATFGRQRTVKGTLKTIVDIKERENITTPAVFVVGRAVEASHGMNWFEKLPLYGKKIVVTRPSHQAMETIYNLAALGADVTHCPTIEIRPIAEAKTFFEKHQNFDHFTDFVFTSENGVKIFFDLLLAHSLDSRSLAGRRVYSIGPTTAEALLSYGIMSEPLADDYSSMGLVESLPTTLMGRSFLIPRATEGSATLYNELTRREATVYELRLYNIAKPENIINIEQADGIMFTSKMTARNFMSDRTWPVGAVAFCIGKSTAEEFNGKGIKCLVSNKSTITSLTEKIIEYFGAEK